MKKRVLIAVLVIAGIAAIAVATLWAYRYFDLQIEAEPLRFTKEKEAMASKIWDRVMVDLEVSYPTSPEGVMDLFNDAFYLMYSNSIVNDGTLLEVMSKQRELYSEDMKTLNPETLQFENLKNALEALYADNNICLSVERKGTVYDENISNECVVQVMIYYNTLGSLYRNYFLIQDEGGRWRVNAWQTTDENYTVIRN